MRNPSLHRRTFELAVAALIATSVISSAHAAAYVPTIGFEHEVYTSVFSVVSDSDADGTEGQVRGAATGEDAKSLAFVCYKDDFCLTVDDGNVLEIVTRVWKRSEISAKVTEMNAGLTQLASVMPASNGVPCTTAGGTVTGDTWPAWTKDTNEWDGEIPEFEKKVGCRKSLHTLIDNLVALGPTGMGAVTDWKSVVTQADLDDVYLFRAGDSPAANSVVANTQVNLTLTTAAFAGTDTLRAIFSEYASTRTADNAKYQLGAELFKQDLGVADDTGFLRLLNYSLGVTSFLHAMGEQDDDFLQGYAKNAYDLYLKSRLGLLYQQVVESLPKSKRVAFKNLVKNFKVVCNATCEQTARDWSAGRDKWTPTSGKKKQKAAAKARMLRDWAAQFDTDLARVRSGDQFPEIAHPWGPRKYDGPLIVGLFEMRDNNFALNRSYSLKVSATGVLSGDTAKDGSDLPNPR